MRNDQKKPFLILLVAVFLLSFCWPNLSFASTNRTMQVESVTGTVYLQKAGGSKSIRLYRGMQLQQGDHLQTSEDSSVILRTLDTKDEVTIGENAAVYIADLQNQQGNKKTKLVVWSGAIYANVTPLTQSKDSFEIETTHSEYSVRGTHFLVNVDPETGLSIIAVLSGSVQATTPNADESSTTDFVYPSQYFLSGHDDTNYTAPMDMDMLISDSSNKIIEAILRNKADIDKENKEFIDQKRRELEEGRSGNELGIQTEIDLERIESNLSNLVGNIVKKAIEQDKVSSSVIQSIIDEANQSVGQKLDLNNVKPLELTESEKQKQEQMKKLEAQRQQKIEAEKKKQEELRTQNQALLQKLEEQKKKLEAANQAAADAKKKQAEELYLSQLVNAEREAFEARKKAFEAENTTIPRVEESTPTATPTAPPAAPPSSGNQDQKAANEVITVISALPMIGELTLEHRENVGIARNALNRLTENQRVLVNNLGVLVEAESRIAELLAEEEVANVIVEIDLLPEEVEITDGEQIINARNSYDALTDLQREQVLNYYKLEDAEAAWAALLVDYPNFMEVIARIADIPVEVTPEDREAIEAARSAYESLSDVEKSLVTNLFLLERAELSLWELVG